MSEGSKDGPSRSAVDPSLAQIGDRRYREDDDDQVRRLPSRLLYFIVFFLLTQRCAPFSYSPLPFLFLSCSFANTTHTACHRMTRKTSLSFNLWALGERLDGM